MPVQGNAQAGIVDRCRRCLGHYHEIQAAQRVSMAAERLAYLALDPVARDGARIHTPGNDKTQARMVQVVGDRKDPEKSVARTAALFEDRGELRAAG